MSDVSGDEEYEYQPPRMGATFGTGPDFGPYVLTRAAEYYQGPRSSTRVAAHVFIPINPEDVEKSMNPNLGWQFYWNLRGYIYVRFWKKGNLWRYGPCTLHDYRVFRESTSKGRHVRSLEVFGHGAAGEDELGEALI